MHYYPLSDCTKGPLPSPEAEVYDPHHSAVKSPNAPIDFEMERPNSVVDFHSQQPFPWGFHGQLPMDMMSMPDSEPQYYHTVNEPMDPSVVWGSDSNYEPPQQPPPTAQHSPFRRDSLNDTASCDPKCTLLPTTGSSSTASTFDMAQYRDCSSPVYGTPHSRWSSSAQPSAISSPYNPSDNWFPTAGSDMVKVEDNYNLSQPHMDRIPDSMSMADSVMAEHNKFGARMAQLTDHLHMTWPDSNEQTIGEDRPVDDPEFMYAKDEYDGDCIAVAGKPKREYTKPENARCSCDVCGKLFARTYNLRAHRATHDPRRSQPHTCPEGGCGRKFVRRADLARHHQSVHLDKRDWSCRSCNHSFSRKDTLQRHQVDGCSRRMEVKKTSQRNRKNNCLQGRGGLRRATKRSKAFERSPSVKSTDSTIELAPPSWWGELPSEQAQARCNPQQPQQPW